MIEAEGIRNKYGQETLDAIRDSRQAPTDMYAEGVRAENRALSITAAGLGMIAYSVGLGPLNKIRPEMRWRHALALGTAGAILVGRGLIMEREAARIQSLVGPIAKDLYERGGFEGGW